MLIILTVRNRSSKTVTFKVDHVFSKEFFSAVAVKAIDIDIVTLTASGVASQLTLTVGQWEEVTLSKHLTGEHDWKPNTF